jgi:hypothetical protein
MLCCYCNAVKPVVGGAAAAGEETYYTPVGKGIVTVSLHGSSLHIDREVYPIPGWCTVPRHEVYRFHGMRYARACAKAAEKIAGRMGRRGMAVLLVPSWHIGGTGMGQIIKALTGTIDDSRRRIKVVYTMPVDDECKTAFGKAPQRDSLPDHLRLCNYPSGVMMGGTLGSYHALLTTHRCWHYSFGASSAFVSALHFLEMGKDAIKMVVPDKTKFGCTYGYGRPIKEICGPVHHVFKLCFERQAGRMWFTGAGVKFVDLSDACRFFESTLFAYETVVAEQEAGAFWTKADTSTYAPTFPDVGGVRVDNFVVVHDDTAAGFVDKLSDKPGVVKKLFSDEKLHTELNEGGQRNYDTIVLQVFDMTAGAHRFDQISHIEESAFRAKYTKSTFGIVYNADAGSGSVKMSGPYCSRLMLMQKLESYVDVIFMAKTADTDAFTEFINTYLLDSDCRPQELTANLVPYSRMSFVMVMPGKEIPMVPARRVEKPAPWDYGFGFGADGDMQADDEPTIVEMPPGREGVLQAMTFGLTPREVVGMKNENGAAFTRVASRPGPRPFIARSGFATRSILESLMTHDDVAEPNVDDVIRIGGTDYPRDQCHDVVDTARELLTHYYKEVMAPTPTERRRDQESQDRRHLRGVTAEEVEQEEERRRLLQELRPAVHLPLPTAAP